MNYYEKESFFISEPIFETETFRLGSKRYCAYCGNIAQEGFKKDEFDTDRIYYYYYCNCENAKAEIELQEKIDELKRNFNVELRKLIDEYKPKIVINKELINKKKYEAELNTLKQKYNMRW